MSQDRQPPASPGFRHLPPLLRPLLPQQRRANDPVTVDLFARKQETPPELEAPKAAPPEPVKLASRELSERPPASIERPLDPNAPVEAHPTGTEPPPEAHPTVETRPPGKIDLNLHTLQPNQLKGRYAQNPGHFYPSLTLLKYRLPTPSAS